MPLEITFRHALRRTLILMDALAVVLAMVAAMTAHTLLREQFAGFKSPPAIESYLLLGYLTLPLWLALGWTLGLYRQLEQPMRPARLLRDLLRLHVYGLLGLTLLIYVTQIYMNRSVVALFLTATFLLMFFTRLLVHLWLQLEYRRGHARQRILLVTDTPRSARHIERRIADEAFPPVLIGCLAAEDRDAATLNSILPVLGSPADIRTALHNNAVDVVLVSCGRETVLDMDTLLDACGEVGVPLRCHIRMDSGSKRAFNVLNDDLVPCIVFESRPHNADSLIAKRAFDISLAFIGLLALAPLLLLITLAILATMGRPVLLKQFRTGYNGRIFAMYKFRTMVRDADSIKADLFPHNEAGGPVFKMRRDPRTTPVGRLLRRSSLDEIPQLWNVLSGQMSLVGPRPLLVDEQRLIGGAQRRRLSMKPGMTGLWQVSGRSDLTFEQWMRLDLEYVDNWSLRLDIMLLLRTIPAVLTGHGAR